MKKICVLLLMSFLISTAFGAVLSKNYVLANQQDFIIISDVQDSEFSIFLSYTGEQKNHCGVSLRTHSMSVSADDLIQILTIEGQSENGQIENGVLVARVRNPKITFFGEDFVIKTKSGKTLAEEISQLSDFEKVELIAEILPCK